jgi:AcrR family transcriptional regulator
MTAARDMLGRSGFNGLTVDAVAKRAGVSPGSVYRRWPTKADLVVAAYNITIGPVEPPDTGSLDTDLRNLAPSLYDFFCGAHGRMLASMVTGAGDDEAVTAVVQEVTAHRRAGMRRMLERAVERGDMSPNWDLDFAMDLIVGPLWTRLLVTREEITLDVIARFVEAAARILRGRDPS